MKTKELIENLENLRDCVDEVYGDVAYSLNEESVNKILSNLFGISLMIDALISCIESEDSKK